MKFDMRLKIVRYAERHGVKPAAREFGCAPKTVRKWLGRWQDGNHARRSLADRSRAPHSCPHKTPVRIEKQILRERKKAPCLGAERPVSIFAGFGAQTDTVA